MLKITGMASYRVSGKIQREENTMNDKDIVQLFFERSQQAVTELSQKYGKLCFHIALNISLSSQISLKGQKYFPYKNIFE